MKIKDIIKELEQLDQEKNLWLHWDKYEWRTPYRPGIVDQEMKDREGCLAEDVNEGDYFINGV